jgi:hypothetical protein
VTSLTFDGRAPPNLTDFDVVRLHLPYVLRRGNVIKPIK